MRLKIAPLIATGINRSVHPHHHIPTLIQPLHTRAHSYLRSYLTLEFCVFRRDAVSLLSRASVTCQCHTANLRYRRSVQPHLRMPAEQKQNEPAPATEPKIQPWRAHWPPRTPVTIGEKHGFQKGEIIQLEGTASGAHLTSLEKEDK